MCPPRASRACPDSRGGCGIDGRDGVEIIQDKLLGFLAVDDCGVFSILPIAHGGGDAETLACLCGALVLAAVRALFLKEQAGLHQEGGDAGGLQLLHGAQIHQFVEPLGDHAHCGGPVSEGIACPVLKGERKGRLLAALHRLDLDAAILDHLPQHVRQRSDLLCPKQAASPSRQRAERRRLAKPERKRRPLFSMI